MSESGDVPPNVGELNIEVLRHIKSAQQVLLQNQRAATIAAETAKFRSSSTKRNVSLLRQLLFGVQDMEEIFQVKEGEEFATIDNVKDVNKAVGEMMSLLTKHKQALQHELNMQVVAASSPLGWKTVQQMEGGFNLPDCVTVENQEVRKAEKESMAYERDLRSAVAGSRRGGKRAFGDVEHPGQGEFKRGRGAQSYRGRNGRGGRGGGVSSYGGGGERTCHRCGDTGHLVRYCTKPLSK